MPWDRWLDRPGLFLLCQWVSVGAWLGYQGYYNLYWDTEELVFSPLGVPLSSLLCGEQP